MNDKQFITERRRQRNIPKSLSRNGASVSLQCSCICIYSSFLFIFIFYLFYIFSIIYFSVCIYLFCPAYYYHVFNGTIRFSPQRDYFCYSYCHRASLSQEQISVCGCGCVGVDFIL